MPEDKSEASKLVKFAPLIAGSVEGNLASGIVPDERLDAFNVVNPDPLPVIEPVVTDTLPFTLSPVNVPRDVILDAVILLANVVPDKVLDDGSVTSAQVRPPLTPVLHCKNLPFVGELLIFKLASSITLSSTVALKDTLPEPLNDCAFAVISPLILKFLVVSRTVAVAALPDVF